MYDDEYEYEDYEDDEEEFESYEEDDLLRCANCGAVIEDPEYAIKVEKYGETYYFCSDECKEEYGL